MPRPEPEHQPPPPDPGTARLEEAGSDDERLRIEAELLFQTDNRPRAADGPQPGQEAEDPLGESFAPPGGADALRAAVLRRARSQLGVHEDPFGSNRTPYSAWYGLIGPWCAMFVSWSFFQEGLPLPATTHRGFAYTPSGAAWFQRQGRWTGRPQVGAVVFFDFPGDGLERISHVGIVEALGADGAVTCLEGNTNDAGGRTGGMVMRHTRRTGIVGYGLPNYGAGLTILGGASARGGAILREGDRGPEVAGWQRDLNEGTSARLAVDGVFGPLTLGTTRTFQGSAGLLVDGEVGTDTRRAMSRALKTLRASRRTARAAPPFPGRLLQAGVEGPDVLHWQAQVSKRGFELAVDGSFGARSEAACRRFQEEAGLRVDGVVGPDTWRSTFSVGPG